MEHVRTCKASGKLISSAAFWLLTERPRRKDSCYIENDSYLMVNCLRSISGGDMRQKSGSAAVQAYPPQTNKLWICSNG